MNASDAGNKTYSSNVGKVFPTLFKKTNTGAIQYWDVFVKIKDQGAEIVTVYGQVGTDKPQTTSDFIAEGKNIGKKNETSAYEQAVKEAKSKWEKQKKKGYTDSKESAQAEEVDGKLVEGGIFPMLAQAFSKHSDKIIYPAYIQPKLDGIRCIATIVNGKASLWTRTRKKITSLPHIVKELENTFIDQTITLDGELYNHELKKDFEKIVSLVRQEEPDPAASMVQYHVYDMVSDKIFADRNDELIRDLSSADPEVIKIVQTGMVSNEEEVTLLFQELLAQGYEGAMLRNAESLYEQNKRSYGLQKVKEFEDAEFKIVGVEEGRGRLQGHVANFVVINEQGVTFSAKMSGSVENLKKYWEDHSLWQGKALTVKYQGLTGKNGVPRFPVGISIRDYE
jgi:ATP-dependent DNA ligase